MLVQLGLPSLSFFAIACVRFGKLPKGYHNRHTSIEQPLSTVRCRRRAARSINGNKLGHSLPTGCWLVLFLGWPSTRLLSSGRQTMASALYTWHPFLKSTSPFVDLSTYALFSPQSQSSCTITLSCVLDIGLRLSSFSSFTAYPSYSPQPSTASSLTLPTHRSHLTACLPTTHPRHDVQN